MQRSILVCALVLLVACFPSRAAADNSNGASLRPLTVIMYPFVPQRAELFAQVEDSFESAHGDIRVKILDLSSNYYDETKPNAITNTEADVLEVDSVFLDDLVSGGKIARLSSTLQSPAGTFLKPAEEISTRNASLYAVPHWVCSNFLFSLLGDEQLSSVKSLADLGLAFPASRAADHGLLIDMKGKSTLGELYLDTELDKEGSLEKAAAHLSVATFDPAAGENLRRVRGLCDADLCRDGTYHERPGFYARQFSRRHGRALAGYSESLHEVADEAASCQTKERCLDLDGIAISPLPLAQPGSTPFVWVDAFVISAKCVGQCLVDAEAFIRHAASAEEVKAALIPAYGQAPRYLLPALRSLYIDPQLLEAAPHYGRFLPLVEHAIPVHRAHLNSDLRDIGKHVDANILTVQ